MGGICMGRRHYSQPAYSRMAERGKGRGVFTLGDVGCTYSAPMQQTSQDICCSADNIRKPRSGSVLPGAYSGASYTTLASTKNSTHWMIEVLCSGCSRWSGRSLRPTDVNTLAWAVGKAPVSQPSNNGSSFARHTNNGMFSVDLTTAKVSRAAFQQYVSSASSKPAASRL